MRTPGKYKLSLPIGNITAFHIQNNLINHLLVGYSQFAEIRSRYSNRAVTYFNTTVGKYSCTLMKQSVLKHNLDFESIILSIIGWGLVRAITMKFP